METTSAEQIFHSLVFIFAFFSTFLFLILLGLDYFTNLLVEEFRSTVHLIKEMRRKKAEIKKKVEEELKGLEEVPAPQIAKAVETVVKSDEKK